MSFQVTANSSTGFSISLTASPTGQIKVWTGSAWVAKPVKMWNGSTWVTYPVKHWNGSAFITTNY